MEVEQRTGREAALLARARKHLSPLVAALLGVGVIVLLLGAAAQSIWLMASGGFVLLVTAIQESARLRRDNAELARIVTSLHDSEARLKDFIELASDWFWEQDADLRFTWGSGIAELTAIANEGFIGRTRWEFGDEPLNDPDWVAHKADLAARRPFRDLRYRRRGADGRPRYLSSSGHPIYDAAGRFVGYRGTGNDVTAQVEAETALRRAADIAEAASRTKSDFLATMGHELRTPLNAIIGFSELIRDQPFGKTDARYVQFAKDIHASGERLLRLLNEVLALARLEADRYAIREERIFLASVVRAAARTLEEAAQQAGVRIDYDSGLPDIALLADRWAINHVVLSLLGNAVRFTRQGGVVAVHAAIVESGACNITVTDTGIGIDAAELENVFEPFYQIDASHSRTHGGTGIGLAICRKLLALHGGSIEISSTPGQGTVVMVTLPRNRVLGTRGVDATAGA